MPREQQMAMAALRVGGRLCPVECNVRGESRSSIVVVR